MSSQKELGNGLFGTSNGRRLKAIMDQIVTRFADIAKLRIDRQQAKSISPVRTGTSYRGTPEMGGN